MVPDDDAPAGDPENPVPAPPADAEASSLTPGGYEYEVVAESESATEQASPATTEKSGGVPGGR